MLEKREKKTIFKYVGNSTCYFTLGVFVPSLESIYSNTHMYIYSIEVILKLFYIHIKPCALYLIGKYRYLQSNFNSFLLRD